MSAFLFLYILYKNIQTNFYKHLLDNSRKMCYNIITLNKAVQIKFVQHKKEKFKMIYTFNARELKFGLLENPNLFGVYTKGHKFDATVVRYLNGDIDVRSAHNKGKYNVANDNGRVNGFTFLMKKNVHKADIRVYDNIIYIDEV